MDLHAGHGKLAYRESHDRLPGKRAGAVLPWFPKGCDTNPLAIFVWPSIGKKLRRVPASERNAQSKLRVALSTAIEELSADPVWVGRARRCCNGVKRRSEWILVRNGREIPKLKFWKKDALVPGWESLVEAAIAGA